MDNQFDHVAQLPTDILRVIFAYLRPLDVLIVASVSTSFLQIAVQSWSKSLQNSRHFLGIKKPRKPRNMTWGTPKYFLAPPFTERNLPVFPSYLSMVWKKEQVENFSFICERSWKADAIPSRHERAPVRYRKRYYGHVPKFRNCDFIFSTDFRLGKIHDQLSFCFI